MTTTSVTHDDTLYFSFRGAQVPVTFGSHIVLEDAQKALQSEPFQTWCRRCERRVALWPEEEEDNDTDNDNKKSNDNDKEQKRRAHQQKQKQQKYQQLEVHSVELQSIDMFGPRKVGFIKIKSHVTMTTWTAEKSLTPTSSAATSNDKENSTVMLVEVLPTIMCSDETKPLPGICFLRGSAVAILVALFCPEEDEEEKKKKNGDHDDGHPKKSPQVYSLLVEQPRVPIGQVACLELPAGMIDDNNASASGIALQELQEECGIDIDPKSANLIDLTELAFGQSSSSNNNKNINNNDLIQPQLLRHLPSAAIPPSPGGCDEELRLFYLEKTVTRSQLNEMKGRLHGLREHGEYITLRVVPMDLVWKVSGDAKAIMALFLVDQLRKEGQIPEAGRLATPLSSPISKRETQTGMRTE